MIHRDKDRHLALLARECRRHIGPPHRIDLRGDDCPIMGFWSMRMALPRGGQQLVGTHQAQDPARRRADTAIPQPGPHLAVAFAGERRCLQDAPDMGHQRIICTGTHWPPPGARRTGRVPLPVEGGTCHAPHAADTRQAARRAAGIPSSRDRRSSASPRSRRKTTSVFCRAENRPGFCHPLVLPSPVALRAPCEGTSIAISCVFIWTPPCE